MNKIDYALIIYFCIISLVTAVFTISDKIFAKKKMWRIPESTLLALGIFGGAPAEYFVMRLIRHKTQHKKFMLGLPFMIILQLIAVILYLYTTHNH